MTECSTVALDVPLQSISECVRIKSVVGNPLKSADKADVHFSSSFLAATHPSSTAASMYLTPSIVRLLSVSAISTRVLPSGQLVRNHT